MAETLPALLAETAARTPKSVALREKRLGIWQEVTWVAYAETVARLARGLRAFGVTAGDRVAIIAENRPAWLYTELATQSVGAAAVGLYPGCTADELCAILRPLAPTLLVVEGQAQVDALLARPEAVAGVAAIIYWNGRGLRTYADDRLRSLDALLAAGGDGEPLATLAAAVQPTAVATILPTFGLERASRLVPLTHANLLTAARGFLQAEPLRPGAEFVSLAPAPWIGDRAFASAIALVAALTVNFPEEPDTVAADLREIGPQVVCAPPRGWARLRAMAEADARGAGALKRRVYRAAVPESPAAAPRLPGFLAEALVYRPVRDRLGLLRARHCYTTGGPIPAEVVQFFRTVGVPLKQLYTVTEAAGPVAVGADASRDETAESAASVGKPLAGLTVERAADGELCLRGAAVADGYLDGDDGAFRDGWFRTGDRGEIGAGGEIELTERAARVARLRDGTEVSPTEIEARLRRSPFIRDAVVVADGRADVAALIAVEAATASEWAERHGEIVTGYADLVQSPAILRLLLDAVRTANADLSASVQIRRFALLPQELSADAGDLTRIGHLRRGAVLQKHGGLVQALDATSLPAGVVVVDRELAEVR